MFISKKYNKTIHKCFDYITKEDIKEHNPNYTKYQQLGVLDLEKPVIDQINLYASMGLKYLNDSKNFIEYSNDMSDIYKNTEE